MAAASAERRANLLREMARQHNPPNGRLSAASSVASDRAYDTESQQLPALRGEPDFQINTSALRRAFPNFSQYGSSDEDSIEMGRGGRQHAKTALNRQLPSEDVTENLSLDFGDGIKYHITGTPPMKPKDTNKIADAEQHRLKKSTRPKSTASEKENQDPALKKSEPIANSKSSPKGRPVLAEMQPRVDPDDTAPLDEVQHSNFNVLAQQSHRNRGGASPNASNKKAAKRSAAQANDQVGQQDINTPQNGTYQSFLLPDLPNITELVSGIRQDGTPLFPRSAKSRSRFANVSSGRKPSNNKPGHIPISSVPVPIDEKALYTSLQLLQEKVEALESDKVTSEKKLEEYELEVLQLRSKLEEIEMFRHSDSGLGTEPEESKKKDQHVEKTKLERSIKVLQERLEKANKKASKSEMTIDNLTKDRDAAHQQLASAYYNSEELKSESQALRDEIGKIKNQLTKLTRQHEKQIDKLTKQEMELRGKIERREKAINQMSSLAKELWNTRNALHASGTDARVGAEHALKPNGVPQVNASRFSSQPSRAHPSFSVGEPQRPQDASDVQRNTHVEKTHRRKSESQVVNLQPEDDVVDDEATTNITTSNRRTAIQQLEKLTVDPTFLSFMEGDEVAKLEKVVQEDKAALAGITGAGLPAPQQDTTRPRKSSIKDISKPKIQDDVPISVVDNTTRSILQDNTQRSARSRRSGADGVEMTSAFILPDITLHGLGVHANQATANQTPPIPTPISARIPEPDADATTRPSQPPSNALATVLHALDAELTSLRAELARQQTLHNQHDPSLGKRARKQVHARVLRLLAAVELRADQIYALYDVLEGLKSKGHAGGEAVQLRNTDAAQVGGRVVGRHSARQRHATVENDDSDDDVDDDELPWEGFEATQTQSLGGLTGLNFGAL